jgi:hypothetical protein
VDVTDADFEAASARREEFLREFRVERQAQATRAHLRIEQSAPGILRWYAEEAAKIDRSTGRKDSYSAKSLRDAFSKEFHEWCSCLPTLLTKFAKRLCQLRPELRWIGTEAKKTYPQLTEECRNWVVVACDGESTATPWRAPGWLAGWPAETMLPASALWERSNANSTAEVTKRIEAEFQCRFDEALGIALERARIVIVEKEELIRKVGAPLHGKVVTEELERRRALGPFDSRGAQRSEASRFEHSKDYRSVRDDTGELHQLTALQAAVVRVLDEAQDKAGGWVDEGWLMVEIGSQSSKVRDIFRSRPRALKALIEKKRSMVRLKLRGPT